MAYPHNPNLSFHPSAVDHYVAFDSNDTLVNNKNKYRIDFEQAYRNVVSISLVSAYLAKKERCVTMKIDDLSNIQSGGILSNGSLQSKSYLDDAFSVFHFDQSLSNDVKQHFGEGDMIPHTKHLLSPIAKLAYLNISWHDENDGSPMGDDDHVLIFKITTSS